MLKIAVMNEHFVAVDKPAGVLTVPSRMGEADERPCLGILLQKEFGKIYPVHRLDFEVSGMVIFARTAPTHKVLSAAFEKRLVKKTYQAWTEGFVSPEWLPGHEETWTSKIQRGKKRSFFAAYGEPAETHVRWDGFGDLNNEGYLKWTLNPTTGRPHQLRLELSSHGYPILGDGLYGARRPLAENVIALRAISLEFPETVRAEIPGLPSSLTVSEMNDFLRELLGKETRVG